MTFTQDEISQMDGGTLRSKFEEALKTISSQTSELAGYRAKEVIGSEGLSLVKPEDLSGVSDLEEMKAKAVELENQRKAAQVDLAKEMFARRGLDGEELEQAVQEFLAPSAGEASTGFETLQSIPGGGQPVKPSLENLHGIDAMAAALASKQKS